MPGESCPQAGRRPPEVVHGNNIDLEIPGSSCPWDNSDSWTPGRGDLSSAGVTRPHRSYDPLRLPDWPLPFLAAFGGAAFSHAVLTTPADQIRCSLVASSRVPAPVSSLPVLPSPFLRRVGVHIFTFEACSRFTRVTACKIAHQQGRHPRTHRRTLKGRTTAPKSQLEQSGLALGSGRGRLACGIFNPVRSNKCHHVQSSSQARRRHRMAAESYGGLSLSDGFPNMIAGARSIWMTRR
jgi:hypothetical protein